MTLVRTGDAQMTCQALANEINQLASADAKPAPKKKGFGFGGFGRALMAVSPLAAMAGNGMGGQVMAQAAGLAQQQAMTAEAGRQTDAALNAATSTQSVAAERKARLLAIFGQKGC